MSIDHPNHSIIKIGQNTEKSPGDVKRLAVTQTPVKKKKTLSRAGVRNSIIIIIITIIIIIILIILILLLLIIIIPNS